ncbi:isoleucine--tRNA ligase [Mailhella massiliensis]|uniref:isoleucine--tRNA ligase n=1 Tax=Mailhella massiliensis TaxID=1903261 RepID=UPI0023545DC4|nr:isoleucine--tRNA ligase [Mailhella massiliensis]
MAEYKKTLNLPVTGFPMKANLVQKEPETLKFWEENHVFQLMQDASGSRGEFVLHDGPPYANGHIHLGTALNKILRDMIIKSRNLMGWKTGYIPGWDCHGLPIEHNVELELGEKKKDLPPHVIRKRCRQYAQKFLDIQRKEFKRLGVLGDWEHPYMSMDPAYEAVTAAELATFVERGGVVRSKKPIYWCCHCKTALAEAEVEYRDLSSPSIYVRFPLPDPKLAEVIPGADVSRAYIVIWTTTPWTLPSNLAVCVHPELRYALVEVEGSQYILASELVESCAKTFGWSDYRLVGETTGDRLEKLEARHPFLDRPSLIINGTHVTLDAGTGCVHTAPGHGREDYEVGMKYGLDVYSPLDDEGRFLPTVEFFAGMQVFEANPAVIAKVEELGHLLARKDISHSYPCCWRCKEPVIFRATTQWFIGMEPNNLRGKALDAIQNKVRWIPSWGQGRIYNMVESRPDWCISRQRMWGVPILALICKDCGEVWNDPAWMREIASRFASHPTGCDYWYEHGVEDVVPEGLVCPHCGGKHWEKEDDILDVWFDSGTSFAAVMEQRPEGKVPADLYLEGSDQHRGWFHSSLLVSVGTRDIAPYKAVLTHGYVVDGTGRKMSKSIGNVVAPQEVIDKYGAELLRLWVASVDYREDIRYSEEIMKRLVDAYRRIRNTCRYLLGSIHDLTPADLVPFASMKPLDRYALSLVAAFHESAETAYQEYEFHKVFQGLHGLCATDLSAFYLDVLKDRLYSSLPDSAERRSAQSALYQMLLIMLRDMAPIMSFTAEEVFRHIPEALKPVDGEGRPVISVFALPQKDVSMYRLSDDERGAWEMVMDIRAGVTRAIEPLRKDGIIGHALDTHVTLYVDDKLRSAIADSGADMRSVCIVSQLDIASFKDAPVDALSTAQLDECPGLAVRVKKAGGEKCERCWMYSEELGTDAAHPTLCPRCAAVMRELEAKQGGEA